MKFISFIFLLLILVSCSGNREISAQEGSLHSTGSNGPGELKEFQSFVDSFISTMFLKENIPGGAFVFVKDGKIFYMKGYGKANLEKDIPVDPLKTIFRIGSISKVFTADAILQLAGNKRLELDADVNKYLTSIKVPSTFTRPISAENILTHTTGLDEIRPGTQAYDSAGVQSLPEFLRNKLVRLWSPGDIIMYSTYGITLGGLLIEDISRQKYEDYMRQNIWERLGMKNTSISLPENVKENKAVGYELEGGKNVPQRWEWYHTTPASSINSTAGDMAQWLIAHLDPLQEKQLMPPQLMEKMLSHQAGMHSYMYGMAFGFFEEYHNSLRFLHHGGNMAGFNSLVVLIPEKNAGFFFVSHHEGSSVRDHLQWAILDRYYKNEPSSAVPVIATSANLKADDFAGNYRYNVYCHSCPATPRTMTMTVKANTDGSIQLNNRRWIQASSKLLFVREDRKAKIAFRQDSDGKVTHLTFGGFWNFEKIQ